MPFYQKDKSRIKMVILTKNGYKNQTIYSPIHQNKKPDAVIMKGMLTRWLTKEVMKVAQIVQFYDMNNNEMLIQKIKVQ